jgi:AmmeMemoRadiSam system protein A
MRDDELGRALIGIARQAIAAEFGLEVGERGRPALHRLGATFVTLFHSGELRGCIGSLRATRDVALDVRENALAAAFRDPRFPPLTCGEFEATRVEVSLLSAPLNARFDSEVAFLERLRPGIDGVSFELDDRRATFLPQVWETLPEPRDFIAALKHKAGIPIDFWSPALNVGLYQVTKWTETDFAARELS